MDTLGSNNMVELFDVFMQGSILSKEVRDEKWIIRRIVWGGVGWHIESDGRYCTEGVEYGLKGTEEDMGLLLTIHAANVP